MEIRVNRCSRRARLTEELVQDAVLREHREAMRASDVEDLVSECVELARLLRSVWASTYDELFGDEPGDLDAMYSIMIQTVRRSLVALKLVSERAKKFVATNYAIAGASELGSRIADIEELEKEIRSKWPIGDANLVAESLAAYRRGEYKTAEELLHESQGVGSQAN